MEAVDVVEVEKVEIACDGGDVADGHPRVFLHIGADGRVDCPYCGRQFRLKEGAPAGGH